MSDKDHPSTSITFEGPGLKGNVPSVSIRGVPSEHINRPEKIRKLMEILELPVGTNARIVFTGEDVIVR